MADITTNPAASDNATIEPHGKETQASVEPLPPVTLMFKRTSKTGTSVFLDPSPLEKRLEELKEAPDSGRPNSSPATPALVLPLENPSAGEEQLKSFTLSPASFISEQDGAAYPRERNTRNTSRLYGSSRSLPQSHQPGGSDPNDESIIMSELAKQLRDSRIDPSKTTLFGKGGAAATALAAVASILGSAVLAALLSPSEVIFTNLDVGIYRYNFCHKSMSETRDNFCNSMRIMYSLCCVITLICDLLCLLSTIIVAIGLNVWLTFSYMFFMLAILTQTLALIAALWLAFPEPAAIGGTILFIAFLVAATLFVLPGIALAWHFKFGLNKSLVLETSGKKMHGIRIFRKGRSSGEEDRGSKESEIVIEGTTVLHWAAFKGGAKHRLLAGVLIAAGENVDIPAKGGDGWTPLMIASYRSNDAIVKQLLAAEADVQLIDTAHGRTALHLAAMKEKNKTTVELLLKAGSDPSVNDVLGHTPLDLAKAAGHDDVVELITKFVENRLNEELLLAVKWRDEDRVKQLLRAGAEANSEDAGGTHALAWAANRGFEEGVRSLIEAKADVNKTNRHGSTALIEAAMAGSSAVVQILLDSNADLLLARNDGYTALDMAARRGHAEVVQTLLTRLDTVDRKAVDLAAQNTRTAALRLLLERVRERNTSCRTLLQAAAFMGSKPAVDLYLEKGYLARDDIGELSALNCAAQEGHLEVVKALLDKSAATERGDAKGKTPLHWAAQEGYADVVKALIEKGAVVDCLDKENRTPLHYAAENGHKEVAEVLLAHRANINVVDKELRTPLFLAARRAHKDVTLLLLDNNSDLASRDSSGMTALDIAQAKGHSTLVSHLKKAKTARRVSNSNIPQRHMSLPV